MKPVNYRVGLFVRVPDRTAQFADQLTSQRMRPNRVQRLCSCRESIAALVAEELPKISWLEGRRGEPEALRGGVLTDASN
jgi:hypothetical protein